ncbi:MAG TPA: helix-turn-helix domain-containing protein [Dehalococcoidia bacterium]|nr:helix-turn-helix domain-containing protein [Dehalococcoidia bacterium]
MNNRYRDNPESAATRWITLGQACKLLGVNESTLRRWADAGHVRSFRTPGGHRRFSEDDLRVLMAGQMPASSEPYNAISNMALARIRRRLQRGKSQSAHWFSNLGEEDREMMRPLGRRLVALVSEYLAKGAKRANLMDEAKEIAREYGRILVRDGMSLRDAVEGFTFFRKTLDETAMEEAQKNELTTEKALELWELLTNLGDQVLISIAESYEEAGVTAGARA